MLFFKTRYLFCFFSLSLLLKTIVGQQQPVLKNFGTQNGLPSNETYFVYSDSKGYIWICTDAGIARYNANSFKVFDSRNGLPDNTIFEVQEDGTGKIWFRPFNGKVGYIFNDSIHTLSIDETLASFVKEGRLLSMALDGNNNLWLGKQNTAANSFLKISPPYTTKDVHIIRSDISSSTGTELLLLTGNNLVFSDSRSSRTPDDMYKLHIWPDGTGGRLITDSFPTLLSTSQSYFDRKGNRLLYATGHQLKIIDLKSGSVQSKKRPYAIISLKMISDSVFCEGTRGKGVQYYRWAAPDSAYYTILGNESVSCISKDYQGSSWVSTLSSGVFYMSSEPVKKYGLKDPESGAIGTATISDENNLLVATESGNLYELCPGKEDEMTEKTLYRDEKKQLLHPNAICRISPDKFLIGGTGGCFFYDRKLNRISGGIADPLTGLKYPLRTISYSGKDVFAAAINSVLIADKQTGETRSRINFPGRIYSIAFDSLANRLYVGTMDGLYGCSFDSAGAHTVKLSGIRVEDMVLKGHLLFMATKSYGLLVKNGDRIDTLSESSGLLSAQCRSVSVHKDELWVSSYKGISKIIYTGPGQYSITNYFLDFFIEPVTIDKLLFLGDRIFFYSGSTIFSFTDKPVKTPDRFWIRALYVNEAPKSMLEPLLLDHDAKNIRIVCEALFYKCNGKILYRYRLDGNWIYTRESDLHLASLAPGNYRLEMEALNQENEWVKANRVICFSINKPFWARWWFILLEVLAVASCLSVLWVWRNRQTIRKQKEKAILQARLYDQETKAIRAQMNPHFIFNSLNAIQRFVLAGDTENAHSYLVRFSRLIRQLIESSAHESIALQTEIEILDKYLDIEQLRFNNQFRYEIIADKGIPENTFIPFMLVQPFIENAIWHGLLPKEGKRILTVHFSDMDEQRIRCVVDDNGVGRSFTKKESDPVKNRSLAIGFIRQRFELLQESRGITCGFSIEDKKNEDDTSAGTRVVILLPKLN